jgi:hypothetical protein
MSEARELQLAEWRNDISLRNWARNVLPYLSSDWRSHSSHPAILTICIDETAEEIKDLEESSRADVEDLRRKKG